MAEFRWYGHNCVRIKSREAVVLIDPVGRNTGYSLPKQTADIVALSHDHPGHANLAAVKPDYHLVTGPGEYEMSDVFITGIRTYHDEANGKERGYNTVYLFEMEGIVICHLGDLGHPLTPEQAEAIGEPDVVIVPAGGGTVLGPERAAEVISHLEPKIVIPVQFATDFGDKDLSTAAAFCKALGVTPTEPEDKLVLKHSELGEAMRLVVLAPDVESRGKPSTTK